MKKQTGIWIDTHRAFIVSLSGSEPATKTVESGIETKVRIPGESKSFTRFGSQYFDDEEKKENKRENEIRDYLKNVTGEIEDADELVIFGPAGMKKELGKFIEANKGLKLELKEIVSADSMTDNQMVAWVKRYFSGS